MTLLFLVSRLKKNVKVKLYISRSREFCLDLSVVERDVATSRRRHYRS